MQRNKYLDELGIPIEKYGSNFADIETDARGEKWKKQREEYGFDDRDIYDLDVTFAEWLYSHIKMYIEIAGKAIDLEFHKFTYDDEEFTLLETLEKICDGLAAFLTDENDTLEEDYALYENYKKVLHLWADVAGYVWW